MRTHTIECPSGLVTTVRTFRVEDEDLLADVKTSADGMAMTRLIEAVTVKVEDPGPVYTIKDGRIDWAKVLQGDRQEISRTNRIKTWGPEYTAKGPCEHCTRPTDNEFDVSTFPLKPLPKSSYAHVTTGVPLTTRLPISGKEVSFRLLRGEDDKALEVIRKEYKNRLSSKLLRLRTVSIEGVPMNELGEWIRVMDAMDSQHLRQAFDDADCGVEQEQEFSCIHCNHVWTADVDLRAGFLFPKYRKKKSG